LSWEELGKTQIKIDPSQNYVQLSGSNMEYYGATIDARPDPTTVPVGASFTIVDTLETWLSNGTTWVVF
jgi:hypothetical protein